MKTRIIAGVIAAFLLLMLISWGSFSLMLAVILFCAAVGYLEFDHLFFERRSLFRVTRSLALISVTIVEIPYQPSLVWLSFVLYCLAYVIVTNRTGDPVKGLRDLTLELLAYVYITSLFGFLLPIASHGGLGRDYLLLLFLIVFVGDTMAYFVGKYFGKHPLAPAISPKKTVEGAIGALVGAMAITALWLFLVAKRELTLNFALKVILFSPLASCLAQVGDLFESVLKRSQAAKDSGSFLPGHGGLLDRVDGLALAAPVFFFYLILVLDRF